MSSKPPTLTQSSTTSDTHNNTNHSYIHDEQAALTPTAVFPSDSPVLLSTSYTDYLNSNSQDLSHGYLPIQTTLDSAESSSEVDYNCDIRITSIPIIVTSLDPPLTSLKQLNYYYCTL